MITPAVPGFSKKNWSSFLQEHTLTDACALQKVFIGKIIARLFVFVQAKHEDTAAFLLNDIRKDILDCRYCG